MTIRHAIWKVGATPEPLNEVSLDSENLLEQMIIADPSILSVRWLLIGQQVHTSHGGFIDLLALNQDGQLIVIELKRNRTPREVVAQALDYASWAKELAADEIATIFSRFSNGGSLGDAFQQRFGLSLDEEQLNGSHQTDRRLFARPEHRAHCELSQRNGCCHQRDLLPGFSGRAKSVSESRLADRPC